MLQIKYFLRLKRGAFALAAMGLVSCDKAPTPASNDAPATPKAEIAVPAATSNPAKAPTQAAAVDLSKLEATYGFLSRLPKTTEVFSATYRFHDLWVQVSSSKFAAAVLDLPFLKEEAGFQDFLQKWQTDPAVQKAKDYSEALFGNEFIIAQPSGAGRKFKPWMNVISELQSIRFQAVIEALLAGKSPSSPDATKNAFVKGAPDLIPLASELDFPPTLLIMNVKGKKTEIENEMNGILGALLEQLPPFVEKENFKVADQYAFQSVGIVVGNALPADKQAELEVRIKNMTGDEAAAKATIKKIMAKRLEIAWGWIDTYLLISIGSDHSAIQIAASPAESLMAVPNVATRAAQFADKKPTTFGYVNKAAFDALYEPFSMDGIFEELAGDLESVLKPASIATMRSDVKKLDAKIAAALATEYQDLVSVGWAEKGFRGEMFGGPKSTSWISGSPLGLSNLFTPTTFMLINSRKDPAQTAKMTDLVEQCAATVWGWYDSFGRDMIPNESRPVFATGEAVALPMIKDFWASSRQLGSALGNESAFVTDLAGSMEELPMVPPPLTAAGRIPRIAYVSELKDRAALSAAWSGYQKIIKQIMNFLPPQEGMPPLDQPVSRKEGDAEIFHLAMPVSLGDVLPHVAVSANRWLISSSPSLTKELVAKSSAPSASSQPLGARGQLSLSALWDFSDLWVKVLGTHLTDIASEAEAQKFEDSRPSIEALLKLAHCIEGFDWSYSDEQGAARQSTHLLLHDLK